MHVGNIFTLYLIIKKYIKLTSEFNVADCFVQGRGAAIRVGLILVQGSRLQGRHKLLKSGEAPEACVNFSLGANAEGSQAESGARVLGEGAATPFPPARGLGERCEFPQRGSGLRSDRPKVFHYFQHSEWPLLTL